ncbi:hypothetical protein R70723_27960 [Paenibacillus sp. FSL R7-0273]|nr:hypothetical protein R70723_27960 [Paenibacillus sp. FSL R7-0273]OMF88019.1 hypothetical protein BK144_22725 [Paenibacillus sp. FSL R7-0273]
MNWTLVGEGTGPEAAGEKTLSACKLVKAQKITQCIEFFLKKTCISLILLNIVELLFRIKCYIVINIILFHCWRD